MSVEEETIARFAEAMLKPLREVGTLLANEVDRLQDEVYGLRAELAEARNDFIAHCNNLDAHKL